MPFNEKEADAKVGKIVQTRMERNLIPEGTIGKITGARKTVRGYTVDVKFEHADEALRQFQQSQDIVSQDRAWELTKEEYEKYLIELP